MKRLVFLIVICLFYSGCKKDNHYIQKVGMIQIENSNMVDTVMLNEDVLIKIKASASNGCWSNLFVNFIKEGNSEFSIKAYGTFSCLEGECSCPAVMVYHDTIIEYHPTQQGTYIFRIYNNVNTIKTDTLIVN